MAKKLNSKKIIVLIIAFVVIGFLLLPVLDGTLGSSKGQKATPQISSSNPLSKAMQAIAAMLGLGKNAPSYSRAGSGDSAYASLTPEQRASLGLDGQGLTLTDGDYDTDTVRLPPEGGPGAQVKDKDGNWVLVKQDAPSVYSRGMYDADMKRDPASVLEGRRISNKIAQDNIDNNADLYASSPMPLSNMLKKGFDAAYNAFGGDANKGGGIDGVGRYSVTGASARGGAGNDLERMLAAVEARARAANAVTDAQGRVLTNDERAAARAEAQEKVRQEALYQGFGKAEGIIKEKILQDAAKEGDGGVLKYVQDLVECNIGPAACSKKSLVHYDQLDSNSIFSKGLSSAEKILTTWVPSLNDPSTFSPEAKQKLVEQFFKTGEVGDVKRGNGIANSGVLNSYKPEYIYIIEDSKDTRAEFLRPDGRLIPECKSEKCFWMPRTGVGNDPFGEKSRLAGGKLYIDGAVAEPTPLGDPSQAKPIAGAAEYDWELFSEDEIKKMAKETNVHMDPEKGIQNIHVRYVTTPSTAVSLTGYGVNYGQVVPLEKEDLLAINNPSAAKNPKEQEAPAPAPGKKPGLAFGDLNDKIGKAEVTMESSAEKIVERLNENNAVIYNNFDAAMKGAESLAKQLESMVQRRGGSRGISAAPSGGAGANKK